MTPLDQSLIVAGHLLSIIGLLCAVLLFSRVNADSRHPGATMAWLLGMIFVPYVAIPFFLLFGGRKVQRLARLKKSLDLQEHDSGQQVKGLGTAAETILCLEGTPPASRGNSVEMIPGAVATYHRMLEMIRGAEHSINIATFILKRDEIGRRIIKELTLKAREGVEVRLLLDSLGCLFSKGRFLNEFREAGGKVGVFMPMLPVQRRWSANLRNHRKIFVVDEREAIVGGRNLGKEYFGPVVHRKQWRDFSMTIKGPAVASLLEIFAADWEFATEEPAENVLSLHYPEDFPAAGDVLLQTVASGPDVPNDPFYEAVLAAMFQARKRVWIVTPYFLPEEMIFRSLKTLARLGRDVRIIVPKKSDRKLVDLARRYFIRELQRAGARVYLYRDRMVHTKLLVIDDETVAVGSPNMDPRSLYLNYEIAVFVYDRGKVRQVERHCEELIAGSDRFVPRRQKKRNIPAETAENVARLFAPLM